MADPKTYEEGYAAGFPVGYGVGYTDGKGAGYTDAKTRTWNAVAAVEMPKPIRTALYASLIDTIGKHGG